MTHVISAPKKLSFNKVGIKGKIFPISELINSTSFVLVETETGHETTIVQYKSDFIYYVIQGEGYFVINHVEEKCKTGDLVVIPAGAHFTYKGKLKLLLSCTPPWTEEQEKTIA